MTESAARFFLTRRAAIDLRSIHARSCREWGEDVADRYIADLYAALRKASANPERGRLRQHRAIPFLMIPAQRHFIIYDLIPQGIAVLTIQHQARNIETLIAELTPGFLAEIKKLKRKGLPRASAL